MRRLAAAGESTQSQSDCVLCSHGPDFQVLDQKIGRLRVPLTAQGETQDDDRVRRRQSMRLADVLLRLAQMAGGHTDEEAVLGAGECVVLGQGPCRSQLYRRPESKI
jgi:hypothetical protein